MKSGAKSRGKKKTNGKKSRKEPKSDMLMSENMEQELAATYHRHHGKPPKKEDFYHKVKPRPEK